MSETKSLLLSFLFESSQKEAGALEPAAELDMTELYGPDLERELPDLVKTLNAMGLEDVRNRLKSYPGGFQLVAETTDGLAIDRNILLDQSQTAPLIERGYVAMPADPDSDSDKLNYRTIILKNRSVSDEIQYDKMLAKPPTVAEPAKAKGSSKKASDLVSEILTLKKSKKSKK